jgi:AcrR family transcriptional regulator
VTRNEPIVKLRKTPSQARSAWTVDVILQAAAQVLEEGGEDALTTKTVAERAGVSIGTLYQYFPNRDAILVALADREAQRIGERMRALIERYPDNREDPGRVMVRALIRSYAARRGARRQFALVVTMTGKTERSSPGRQWRADPPI